MSLLSFQAYKRWFLIITDVVCSYLLFFFHGFFNAIFCARIGCFKVGISQFLLQEEPPNNSKTRCGLGSTDKRSFHSGCFGRPRMLHAPRGIDRYIFAMLMEDENCWKRELTKYSQIIYELSIIIFFFFSLRTFNCTNLHIFIPFVIFHRFPQASVTLAFVSKHYTPDRFFATILFFWFCVRRKISFISILIIAYQSSNRFVLRTGLCLKKKSLCTFWVARPLFDQLASLFCFIYIVCCLLWFKMRQNTDYPLFFLSFFFFLFLFFKNLETPTLSLFITGVYYNS